MESYNEENEIPLNRTSFASYLEEREDSELSILKNLSENIPNCNKENAASMKMHLLPSISDLQKQMHDLQNENYNMKLHIFHLEEVKDNSINFKMKEHMDRLIAQNDAMRKAIAEKDYLNRHANTAINELKSEIKSLKEEDSRKQKRIQYLLERNSGFEAAFKQAEGSEFGGKLGHHEDPMKKLLNALREVNANIEPFCEENESLSSQINNVHLNMATVDQTSSDQMYYKPSQLEEDVSYAEKSVVFPSGLPMNSSEGNCNDDNNDEAIDLISHEMDVVQASGLLSTSNDNPTDLPKIEDADEEKAGNMSERPDNKSGEKYEEQINALNTKLSKAVRALKSAFDKIKNQKKIIEELTTSSDEKTVKEILTVQLEEAFDAERCELSGRIDALTKQLNAQELQMELLNNEKTTLDKHLANLHASFSGVYTHLMEVKRSSQALQANFNRDEVDYDAAIDLLTEQDQHLATVLAERAACIHTLLRKIQSVPELEIFHSQIETDSMNKSLQAQPSHQNRETGKPYVTLEDLSSEMRPALDSSVSSALSQLTTTPVLDKSICQEEQFQSQPNATNNHSGLKRAADRSATAEFEKMTPIAMLEESGGDHRTFSAENDLCQDESASTYSTGYTWPVDQLRSFHHVLTNLLRQLSNVQVLRSILEQSLDQSFGSILELSLRHRSMTGDSSLLNASGVQSQLDSSRPLSQGLFRLLMDTSVLNASGIPQTPGRFMDNPGGNVSIDQHFNEAALEELRLQLAGIYEAIKLCSDAGYDVYEQIKYTVKDTIYFDRQNKCLGADDATDVEEFSEITSLQTKVSEIHHSFTGNDYSEILSASETLHHKLLSIRYKMGLSLNSATDNHVEDCQSTETVDPEADSNTAQQFAEVIDEQNELTKAIAELIRRVHPILKQSAMQSTHLVDIQETENESENQEKGELLKTIEKLTDENETLKQTVKGLEVKLKRFESGLDHLRETNLQIVSQLNFKGCKDADASTGDPLCKPDIEEMRKQLEKFELEVCGMRKRIEESESLNNELDQTVIALQNEILSKNDEIKMLQDNQVAALDSLNSYEKTIMCLREDLAAFRVEADKSISANRHIERMKAKCSLIINTMRDSLQQIDNMERYVTEFASNNWNSSEELDRLHDNYLQCLDALQQIVNKNQPTVVSSEDNPHIHRLQNIEKSVNDNIHAIRELKESSAQLHRDADLWLEKRVSEKQRLITLMNDVIEHVGEDLLSLEEVEEAVVDKKGLIVDTAEHNATMKKYQYLIDEAKMVTKQESDLQYLHDSLKMKTLKLRDCLYEQKFGYANISKVISVNHYAMEVEELKQKLQKDKSLSQSSLCAIQDIIPDESDKTAYLEKMNLLTCENNEMKIKIDELESERFSLNDKLDTTRINLSKMKCQLEKEINTLNHESRQLSEELKKVYQDLKERNIALDKLSTEYNEIVSDKVKLIEDLSRSLDTQNNLKNQLDLKMSEVEEIKNELVGMNENYAKLKSEFSELTDTNGVLALKVKDNAELKQINEMLDSKNQELTCWLQEKVDAIALIEESKSEVSYLLNEMRNSYAKLEEDLNELQSEKQCLAERKDSIIAQLNQEVNGMRSDRELLGDQIEVEVDRVKKLRAKLEVSETSNKDLTNQINELVANISSMEMELSHYKTKNEFAEQENKDLQMKVTDKLEKINRLENQVRQLTDLLKSQGSVMPSCVKDVRLLEKKVEACLEELDNRKKLVKELKEKLISRTGRLDQSLKDNERLKKIVKDDCKRINEFVEEAKAIRVELEARNIKIIQLESTIVEMSARIDQEEGNVDASVEQVREASCGPIPLSCSNQSNIVSIKNHLSSMSLATECGQCSNVLSLMEDVMDVQMRSNESINECLRVELSILNKTSANNTLSNEWFSDSQSVQMMQQSAPNLDHALADYMQEFRSLRANLEERIAENDKLRISLIQKLHCEIATVDNPDHGSMENAVKQLQEKLRESENLLNLVQKELTDKKKELLEEQNARGDQEKAMNDEKFLNESLRSQLQATQELVNTLKSENNLLRSYHESDRKSSSGKSHQSDDRRDFDRFIEESVNLREQLENAVQSNAILHEKLEEFCRNSSVGVGLNPDLSETREFTASIGDRRTRHAVAYLEDYELLKKQIQEGLTILKNLECQLAERLQFHKVNSPFKNEDYCTYRELHGKVSSLLYYLHLGERLLSGFWTKYGTENGSTTQCGLDVSKKDTQIEELSAEIDRLQAKLKRSSQRFKSLKECYLQQEKRYEAEIIKKLSSTDALLNSARENLEKLTGNN